MKTKALCVAPIVEGHGEERSLRLLLERLRRELLSADYVDVLRPNRKRRDRLIHNKGDELAKAVEAAARELAARPRDGIVSLILVLIDSDEDCAVALAASMQKIANATRPDARTACVVAVKEYETWFVAAAESLSEYLNVADDEPPINPEQQRCGKAWIEKRFLAPKYSETTDQPRLTAKMDLQICRERCPSFDKLCRELEKAMVGSEP